MYRVTVLMPTWNRLKMFKQALKSALMQDYKNIEILIIANGCTDGTDEYIRTVVDDRVWSITLPKNSVEWLNLGIVRASGELICQCHDDDEFYDSQAVSSRAALFDDGTVDCVYASAWNMYEGGNFKEIERAEPPDYRRMRLKEYTPWTTWMWRKKVHDKTGMFPETLTLQVDRWFKNVAMRELKCRALDRPVMRYRIWHGQDSAIANRNGKMAEDSERCEKLLKERWND